MSEELTIRYVPLSTVQLWDRNPKRHSIGDLAASIERYGFKEIPKYEPTLNSGQGGIVAGNGRIETLVALHRQNRPAPRGILVRDDEWLVPVTFGVDAASQEEAEAYGLDSNNLGLSGGDFTAFDMARLWGDGYTDILAGLATADALPITVDGDALDGLLKALEPEIVPGDGGDEFDTTPADGETRCQSGDLWIIDGKHRLLVGDCTDPANVARLMGGVLVDCVFTSPPYAVGVEYGDEYQDTIDNLREMLPKLSQRWLDIVTPGGFAVVNFGDIAPARNIAGSDAPCEYPMAMEYWPVFRADGWLLWSRRIWCKPNPRVHSPWCIQSNRAATDWEHLWTWRKPGEPIIRRVDGEMRSALGWYQSSLMHGVDIGKEIHGAGMALGIVEWMLNIHSRPRSAVFEPFGGTGTTLVAGHRMGRTVYSCEIVPRSADVILRRAEAEGLHCERAE